MKSIVLLLVALTSPLTPYEVSYKPVDVSKEVKKSLLQLKNLAHVKYGKMFEPLKINPFKECFAQPGTGMEFEFKLKCMDIYGLTNFLVNNVQSTADAAKKKWLSTFYLKYGEINSDGTYHISGTVMPPFPPVEGEGTIGFDTKQYWLKLEVTIIFENNEMQLADLNLDSNSKSMTLKIGLPPPFYRTVTVDLNNPRYPFTQEQLDKIKSEMKALFINTIRDETDKVLEKSTVDEVLDQLLKYNVELPTIRKLFGTVSRISNVGFANKYIMEATSEGSDGSATGVSSGSKSGVYTVHQKGQNGDALKNMIEDIILTAAEILGVIFKFMLDVFGVSSVGSDDSATDDLKGSNTNVDMETTPEGRDGSATDGSNGNNTTVDMEATPEDNDGSATDDSNGNNTTVDMEATSDGSDGSATDGSNGNNTTVDMEATPEGSDGSATSDSSGSKSDADAVHPEGQNGDVSENPIDGGIPLATAEKIASVLFESILEMFRVRLKENKLF